MSREPLNRRDFNKLSMAALGGLAAGTAIGCGGGDEKDKDKKDSAGGGGHAPHDGGDVKVTGSDCWLSGEKNVCRGLNICKGHGQGDHTCAGQSSCFSGMEKHGCQGENGCNCEGGCGTTVGENACKGKGSCAVPLHGHEELEEGSKWAEARAKFEAAFEAAGKTFGEPGPAPAAS